MFKEKRLIYQEASPERGPSKPRESDEWLRSLSEKRELLTPKEFLKEGAEREKAAKEAEIKVREQMLNDLEFMNKKCPRCGSTNIKQIQSNPDLFKCTDCKNVWEKE